MADWEWPAERLVAAARGGDAGAITALVSGSHPHVRRFARSMCASREDAEDAAQEALIILYRRIGMLRATAAPASWMFRIVRNECIRRARGLRRYEPYAAAETSAPSAPAAEDQMLLRLELERVTAAIAALPQEQRTVLIMRDVRGLDGRSVAAALGIGSAAMKSRLHRARAAVQRSLRGDDDE